MYMHTNIGEYSHIYEVGTHTQTHTYTHTHRESKREGGRGQREEERIKAHVEYI